MLPNDSDAPPPATTSPPLASASVPEPTISAASEVTADSAATASSAEDAVAPAAPPPLPPAPVAASERREGAAASRYHPYPIAEFEFEQELNNLMAVAAEEMDEDAHADARRTRRTRRATAATRSSRRREETGDDADDVSHLQDLDAVMASTDADGNWNSTSPSGAYRRLPRRTLFCWGPCETGLPGWYFARSDFGQSSLRAELLLHFVRSMIMYYSFSIGISDEEQEMAVLCAVNSRTKAMDTCARFWTTGCRPFARLRRRQRRRQRRCPHGGRAGATRRNGRACVSSRKSTACATQCSARERKVPSDASAAEAELKPQQLFEFDADAHDEASGAQPSPAYRNGHWLLKHVAGDPDAELPGEITIEHLVEYTV